MEIDTGVGDRAVILMGFAVNAVSKKKFFAVYGESVSVVGCLAVCVRHNKKSHQVTLIQLACKTQCVNGTSCRKFFRVCLLIELSSPTLTQSPDFYKTLPIGSSC